jgi:hypothetical protein
LNLTIQRSVAYLEEFLSHYRSKDDDWLTTWGGIGLLETDETEAEEIVLWWDMETLGTIVSMVSSYLVALSKFQEVWNTRALIAEKTTTWGIYSPLIPKLKLLQRAVKYIPQFDLSGDFQQDLRNMIENWDTMWIVLSHVNPEQ